MASEIRHRKASVADPSLPESLKPTAVVTLEGFYKAVIVALLVLSVVLVIFAILTYVEVRNLRHDLAVPPANGTSLSAAKSAMEVATQVFRRKKQFIAP